MYKLNLACGPIIYKRLSGCIDTFRKENTRFSKAIEKDLGISEPINLVEDLNLPPTSYQFSAVNSNQEYTFIKEITSCYLDPQYHYYKLVNEMLFRQFEDYIRKQLIMGPFLWKEQIEAHEITLEMDASIFNELGAENVNKFKKEIQKISLEYNKQIHIFSSVFLSLNRYQVWNYGNPILGSWFDADECIAKIIHEDIITATIDSLKIIVSN
ncbi:hypothetical protein GC101_34175 [Paenibacillus sp. LMG 31459]|uniref:Uncharacterized protein n=1 Tax=Paenibacillus phytohabitans TaxID=2654978 RepID=A0ABX1YUJ0_9BACL|nr:hypothetical protein [Paenibacillus phytohabitans]NOU83904.1 hypothetical protein [Paenibacillus phytohabitans]